MTYYDKDKRKYITTTYQPHILSTAETSKVEYATKDELKEAILLDQSARAKMTTVIGRHGEAIDDLYNRHDTMRNDLNNIIEYANYLQRYINNKQEAPKAGKRRRRVTIIQG